MKCLSCEHSWIFHHDYNESLDRYILHDCEYTHGCNCKYYCENENENQKIARLRWLAGEKPSISTDVADNLRYGYGELDPNGFWEYQLSYEFLDSVGYKSHRM